MHRMRHSRPRTPWTDGTQTWGMPSQSRLPAPSRWPAACAAAALACLLALPALPVQADHAQIESGKVVVFDHKGGNEWWVEVFLGGQDGGQASAVSALDDGGPWVPLAKKSW